jgi:glycosyltransferase involved in cell wall biosynthesis
MDELQKARAVMVPSTTIEGFPMVLAEACAAGTPALVSNTGPLPAIVRMGGFGEALDFADTTALATALTSVNNPEQWRHYHGSAISYFGREISAPANASRLLDIYSRISGARS